MIEKKFRLGNLFDFYGELLTDKQQNILELYILEDFSFGEISDNHNISRQAVYDTVKRSEKILEDYELKLGLMEKFHATESLIKDVSEKMDLLISKIEDSEVSNDIADVINEVKSRLTSI
ncbi:MAG: putative DNA-binding protein [Acidaminobacteraceae bacterium]